MHPIFVFQCYPLSFFHIDFHIHEMLVEKFSGIRVGKHLFRQHLARTAPGSIAIHKYQLVLSLCLIQCLLPGALLEHNTLGSLQSSLSVTDKLLLLGITAGDVNRLAFPIHENIGRVPVYAKTLCQLLLLPEIYLHIDKMLIVIISHRIQ